jgi:hypothetical protein
MGFDAADAASALNRAADIAGAIEILTSGAVVPETKPALGLPKAYLQENFQRLDDEKPSAKADKRLPPAEIVDILERTHKLPASARELALDVAKAHGTVEATAVALRDLAGLLQ